MLESMLFGVAGSTSSVLESEIAEVNLDTVEECAGDPFDYILSAMYENELNFANIEKTIMLDEFAYLYENGIVIEESADRDNPVIKFLRGIKETVQKIWRKIVAFFRSVFSKLDMQGKADKSFVKKYKEVFDKATGIGGIELGKEILRYSGGKALDEVKQAAINALEKVNSIADKATADINATKYDKKDAVAYYAKEFNINVAQPTMKDVMSSINADILGYNVKSGLEGREVRNLSVSDVNGYLSEIEGASAAKKAVQDTYNTVQKAVNKLLKEASELEKAAGKDAKEATKQKDTDTARQLGYARDAYYVAGRVINLGASIASGICSSAVKTLVKINNNNKAIVRAAAAAVKKSSKNSVDESAYFGGSEAGFDLL